jgi:hypothetical protein
MIFWGVEVKLEIDSAGTVHEDVRLCIFTS